MSDFGDSVFTIILHDGKWRLFRKLRKNETGKCEKLWVDENGEYWIYLFCSEDRHDLEICVKRYRTIEANLIEITKVAAGELKYDDKGDKRL